MKEQRNKMQEIEDMAQALHDMIVFEEDMIDFMKDAAIERLIREELDEKEKPSDKGPSLDDFLENRNRKGK